MKRIVLKPGEAQKIIVSLFFMLLFILQQATATRATTTTATLNAQNKMHEYTKDAVKYAKDSGEYQQTKKAMRDIREYKPALNNEHLNHLLGLYGARRKRLQLSTECNLIHKDAYSDTNEDNDENESGLGLSESVNKVDDPAARNAIYSIVDESDMDDRADREKSWQKLDKSLFDNLKFVDVPDDHQSNNEETKPEIEDDGIVNEQNDDVRERKKAENVNNARHESDVTKAKHDEPQKQSVPLKVTKQAAVKLKTLQKLIEASKEQNNFGMIGSKEKNALAVPVQKEKQDFKMAEQKESNILNMIGQNEPLLVDNDESKSVNRLGTKDFIVQAQKDVDLAKKAYQIFKKVSEEIYSNKRNIRIGGLYDEYKKRLDTILQQKRSRGTSKITSDKDLVLKDVKSEFSQNETPSSGCGCNNDVAVISSLKKTGNADKGRSGAAKVNVQQQQLQQHQQQQQQQLLLQQQHQQQRQQQQAKKKQHRRINTHRKIESSTGTQPQTKIAKLKGKNANRNTVLSTKRKLEVAKVTKEKERPAKTVWKNPYFLPNSKFKQTPFSEVPFKPKAGFADEPKNSDDVKTASMMPSEGSSGGASTNQVSSCNSGTKLVKVKSTKQAAAKLEPYLGVNTTYIKTALQALGDVPYSSLYDEYQKQMGILNHMLRAKQRWWNEARKIGSLRTQADAQEHAIVTAAFAALPMPTYSTTGSCQLVDDAASSAHIAGRADDATSCKLRHTSSLKRRNSDAPNQTDPQVLAKTLEYTLNQATSGQSGGNLLTNAASRMNMTATELAQRLTNTSINPFEENFAQVMKKFVDNSAKNVSSPANTPQSGGNALPNTTDLNSNRPGKNVETPDGFLSVNTAVPVALTSCAAAAPPPSTNINNVLDKILQKLEHIQEAHGHADVISSPADTYVFGGGKTTNYCAENPTDGSPCHLTGSWQSSFLGVRFDISSVCVAVNETQTCGTERQRRSWFRHKPNEKQCVQISNFTRNNESLQSLQVLVQEIVPPRRHDFMENLREWHFDAWTGNLLGGPLVMTVRKCGTQLMGTFIGYCRTCGCVDTIFGSWTFCTPSKDCQDITMAFFEKREMLRRYKMDENRRERYKAMLFNKSSFSKKEVARTQSQRKDS